jgi:hypothetical protein
MEPCMGGHAVCSYEADGPLDEVVPLMDGGGPWPPMHGPQVKFDEFLGRTWS